MYKRMFLVTSEALLIFLSAVLGTFAWNHLSPIFNSMDWWGGLMKDIAMYWPAYLTIGVLGFILVLILYFRSLSEKSREEKILEAIARRLGVPQEDIEKPKKQKKKDDSKHKSHPL